MMRSKIKQAGLTAVLFFIINCISDLSSGQTNIPKVIPPSPTAMQFQRYGDYPVSNFTGVPQISIPLYTVKDGDVELPISLDYHASGIRVNDVPGFVGLGWTLNVGGMVSREIHDKPDELYPFRIPPMTASNILPNYKVQEINPLIKGSYDHEYDVYSYNFFGESGKFILKNEGGNIRPFLFPYKPLKVDFSQNSGGTIITANGTQYGFGGQPEYVEFTDLNDNIQNPNTSWHLVSIQSASNLNQGIGISYYLSKTYIQDLATNQIILDDSWTPPSNDVQSLECHLSMGAFLQYSIATTPIQGQSLIKHHTCEPKEVLFSSGKVKFIKNETTGMLSSVEVYDANNNPVKKISLDITAFATNQTINPDTKYKLAAVHIKDNQSNEVSTYSFNYENENIPDAIPAFTFDKDYWGFYNAAGNSTSIPKFQNFLTRNDGFPYGITIGNANRNPSETSMKIYSLNKITYPTGGYTIFDLGANNTNSPNKVVGGLRVNAIKNYTADGKLATQKTYTYGAGVQEVTPTNDLFLYSQYGSLPGGLPWFRRNYYSENPAIDLSPQGSSVVYPTVTETDNNGSIKYEYDYGNAFSYEDLDYPFFPTVALLDLKFKKVANNGKPWNFGNLIRKTTFSSNASSVNVEENDYDEIVRETARDFLLERTAFPTTAAYHSECAIEGEPYYFMHHFDDQNDCFLNFADHYYISGEKRLKKTTTTYTDKNLVSLSTAKNFEYSNPDHDQPTSIITTNSKGDTIKTVTQYPHDFKSTGTPNIYNEMVERHIWSAAIVQSTYKNNNFLQSSRTNYNSWFNHAWGLYDPNSIITTQTVETKVQNNPWETRIQYDSVDERGNIKEVSKVGDVKHSYIWGYGKLYPVAEIVGADYHTAISFVDQSVLDNPTTTESQMRTELNKIRTGLAGAKALVTTYTYRPLIGTASQTDANNKTTYYEYDPSNRLKQIKDNDSKILKRFEYNYFDPTTASQTAAQWQNITNGYCEVCKTDNNFVTGVYKVQQVDNNPSSITYNQTRWIDTYSTSCVSNTPDWQATGNLRCATISNQNTGYQEREERLMNPCNAAYNQIHWVNIGQNTNSCPLPPYFTSDDESGQYTRNNCSAPDYAGTSFTVPVPAGMFTSTISVADANNHAMAYAQNIANQDGNGTCVLVPFDFHFENLTTYSAYDIDLIDPPTRATIYSFHPTVIGSFPLGSILPGTYDIHISLSAGTANHIYSLGCGFSVYGLDEVISNVPLSSSNCNSITIRNY